MRIGFFGNGALGEKDAQVRDGTVADRYELFEGLKALGHEPLYLAPRERSPGNPDVVGYDWRGDLDILILECRDAVWPPQVRCRSAEGDCLHPPCVDVALASIPVYQQAKVLRDWDAGKFGRDTRLAFIDFDLNVRRVIGLAGRTSTYVTGKFWQAAVPWMSDVLERVRMESVVLVPYYPQRSLLVRKRRSDEGYQVRRWVWSYPTWLEREGLLPWSERRWDLIYTGSDYDRRRRWWEFYGTQVLSGAKVAVTGTWGDRRGGRDRPPWNAKRFRSRLTHALTMGADVTGYLDEEDFPRAPALPEVVRAPSDGSLSFLSPATTIQLPFGDMLEHLGGARMLVQVVPDEYASLGYFTNRVAEAAAFGVPVYVDAEIDDPDLCPPAIGEWARVRDRTELAERVAFMEGEADGRWVRWYVQQWRDHLRARHGDGPGAARRLLEALR